MTDCVATLSGHGVQQWQVHDIGAAAGIRTRVVGLEGQWTPRRNVLDQARLRPHLHDVAWANQLGLAVPIITLVYPRQIHVRRSQESRQPVREDRQGISSCRKADHESRQSDRGSSWTGREYAA
jgi:hypothetical protein